MPFQIESATRRPKKDPIVDAPDNGTVSETSSYATEISDTELSDAELGDLEKMGLESKTQWELQQMTLDPEPHVRAGALAELEARNQKLTSRVKTRESGVSAEWKATPEWGKREATETRSDVSSEPTTSEPAPTTTWRDLVKPTMKMSPRVQHERSKLLAGQISKVATSEDSIYVKREGTVEGTTTAHVEYSDGMVSAGGGVGIIGTGWEMTGSTALGDKGAKSMQGVSVAKAQAGIGGSVGAGKDGIRLSGDAGASVTMVGGHAKLQSAPVTFKFLGEELRAMFTAGVKASVLAEAKGDVRFDVSKGDTPAASLALGGSTFAGARAGVELGAEVKWQKGSDYKPLLVDFVKALPGTPDWLVDQVDDSFWAAVERVMVGNKIPTLIAGVKAGVDGSAGIGGSAGLNLGFSGGQITVDGHVSGTVGLGVGTHLTTTIDALEGLRYLSMLAVRGSTSLLDQISEAGSWFDEATYEVLGEVEVALRETEEEGGVTGWMAGAAKTAGGWVGAW